MSLSCLRAAVLTYGTYQELVENFDLVNKMVTSLGNCYQIQAIRMLKALDSYVLISEMDAFNLYKLNGTYFFYS